MKSWAPNSNQLVAARSRLQVGKNREKQNEGDFNIGHGTLFLVGVC